MGFEVNDSAKTVTEHSFEGKNLKLRAHYTVTYNNESNEFVVYLDGKKIHEGLAKGSEARIGAGRFFSDEKESIFTAGMLDDVRIYNRVLSDEEINNAMLNIIPEPEPEVNIPDTTIRVEQMRDTARPKPLQLPKL